MPTPFFLSRHDTFRYSVHQSMCMILIMNGHMCTLYSIMLDGTGKVRKGRSKVKPESPPPLITRHLWSTWVFRSAGLLLGALLSQPLTPCALESQFRISIKSRSVQTSSHNDQTAKLLNGPETRRVIQPRETTSFRLHFNSPPPLQGGWPLSSPAPICHSLCDLFL